MSSESTEAFWVYLTSMSELLINLNHKTMGTPFGPPIRLTPAEARLHMKLCGALSAHAETLENNFRETNGQCGDDSSDELPGDTGSQGDRPPDPE